MRICFITEEFPPETDWGGIATLFYNQAKGLDKLGHEVVVIARSLNANRKYIIKGTHIQVHTITPFIQRKIFRIVYYRFLFGMVRKILLKMLPELWNTLEWNFFAFLQFKKIHNNFKFDIVETPEYHFNGLFVSLATKVHHIVLLNGNKILTLSTGRERKFELFLLDFFERLVVYINRKRLIANSKTTARMTKTWVPIRGKIPVIYPFIFDTDSFIKISGDIGIENFILFVGRLEERKGPHLLLQAFTQVSEKYPQISLVFIGKDTQSFESQGERVHFRTFLKNTSTSNNIRKKIHVLPHLRGSALRIYYEKSIFCVFPSRYEPFGMVVLEAMSFGKAVIASKNGGPSEFIVNKKNGILVTPKVNEIVDSLELLIKNGVLRSKIGMRAEQIVKEKFNADILSKRLEKFYLKCLSQ